MKYLLKYNEGLFNLPNDSNIVKQIVDEFDKIVKPDITQSIIEDNVLYIAKDLRLDINPGTYTITCKYIGLTKEYELKVEYCKNGKLQFTKVFEPISIILNALISTLFKKMAAKYVAG
jgi:hypothetical protein